MLNYKHTLNIQNATRLNQCKPRRSLDIQSDWYRRDEGSDKPCAIIENHIKMA